MGSEDYSGPFPHPFLHHSGYLGFDGNVPEIIDYFNYTSPVYD
jgi:hypothetical protein